jgi:hypothetical protein
MNVDWPKIGRVVFWGLVGGLTAIQTAEGLPTNAVGWSGLALAVLWSAAGKGTTSTKTFAIGRDVWTEDERRKAAGLPPKRPVGV